MNNKLTFLAEDDYNYIMGNEKRPILVFFTAVWEENCQKFIKTIEIISQKAYPGCLVYSCDIDACPLVAAKCSVTSIPSLILFLQGREVSRLVGVKTLEETEEMLKKHGVII